MFQGPAQTGHAAGNAILVDEIGADLPPETGQAGGSGQGAAQRSQNRGIAVGVQEVEGIGQPAAARGPAGQIQKEGGQIIGMAPARRQTGIVIKLKIDEAGTVGRGVVQDVAHGAVGVGPGTVVKVAPQPMNPAEFLPGGTNHAPG